MSNFAARINAVAASKPDRTAIEQVHADGSVDATSYGALDTLAGRTGAWLLGQGIQPGDRIAILADNDARWIAAYLGILRIGAVAVPLDTAYKAAQVRTVLDNSGARRLFTTLRYLETAREATAVAAGGVPVGLALLAGAADGVVSADAVDQPRERPPVKEVTPEAAAVILYTSGTTADPKGVVLTHGNLDSERQGAFAIVNVTEDDAILGVLPLFHALAQMANLLLPLAVGARVVFLDTVSSSTLVGALGARGISIFACVPQFFYLIHQRITSEVGKKGAAARAFLRAVIAANVWFRDRLGLNPGKLVFGRVHRSLGTKMRLFVTGGSKFDAKIGRDLYGLGFTILNAYGLTETSGGATIVRPQDRFNESVGQPFPGVEIRILKATAAERASGELDVADEGQDHGEVLIRGPILMREYFNRPDATAEALRDGWLHTGDLGRLDEEGRLYITGRKKEIIVLSSGKNLYPEEIESHYRKSAFIKELCVLGLSRPGEPAAERLHALIVPDDAVMRERGIVNLRELLRFEIESLSVQLPPHKRILSYDVSLEPLPRTTTGKIRRHEIQRRLRERAAAEAEPERTETSEEAAWRSVPEHAAALDVVARKLDKPAIKPDANLELDLGLDSMERVELLTLLEQRRGSRVPADARATIFTVRQLIDAVEAAPAAGPAASAGMAVDSAGELPWETLLSAPVESGPAADLARTRPVAELVSFLILRTAGLAMRIAPGFRISGREHLPREGPFLICPNHQAYLDPFFLGASLPFRTVRQMFFVGASEYFESPLMRRLARAVNLIPVDPDANLVTAMQAGAAGLRLKKALILFPEGERSIDGELKKFRKGASILAAHLDAPIVPVAMDGLYELWPRGRKFNWRALLPWRSRPVTIEFGPPITVRRGAYTEGTAALRSAVAAMFERHKTTPEPGVRPRPSGV
jgi:long-chain acyl-CoA synthetase